MLTWKANFQIPNSGVQAREVFAYADAPVEGAVLVKFYAEADQSVHLFDMSFEIGATEDVEAALSALEYFSEYSRVESPVVEPAPKEALSEESVVDA